MRLQYDPRGTRRIEAMAGHFFQLGAVPALRIDC